MGTRREQVAGVLRAGEARGVRLDPPIVERQDAPTLGSEGLAMEGLDDLKDWLAAEGFDIVHNTQLEGHERFYTYHPFGDRVGA